MNILQRVWWRLRFCEIALRETFMDSFPDVWELSGICLENTLDADDGMTPGEALWEELSYWQE